MSPARLLIYAAIGLLTRDISASEPPNLPPSIEFGCYPLPILRTFVSSEPGTPAANANFDTPCPNDFPPRTFVAFEDAREFPAFKKGARYFSAARNNITIFRITEVERAPYKTIQIDIEKLKKLLKERPKEVALGEDRRSVRAFERTVDGRRLEFFQKTDGGGFQLIDAETGSTWNFEGKATAGPLAGKQLKKVFVLEDYWFDWRLYHPDTRLYDLK